MSSKQESIINFFKPREKKAPSPKEDTPKPILDSSPSKQVGAKVPPASNTGGQELSFEELCNVFARIEATSKRLEINDILKEYFGEFLRKGEEAIDGLVKVVHLCLSRLGPAYAGVELGLGEQLLMKAISGATGHSLAKTKQEVEEKGDIGLVAETSRSSQKTMFQPKPLTVAHIFKTLQEIAAVTGQNSMQRKVDKVKTLFVACKGKEARYLFRLLEGKLRIGLAEQSVLAALAHASADIFDSRDAQTDDQPALAEPVAIIKSVYKYPL